MDSNLNSAKKKDILYLFRDVPLQIHDLEIIFFQYAKNEKMTKLQFTKLLMGLIIFLIRKKHT